jgi:hypothetical protein
MQVLKINEKYKQVFSEVNCIMPVSTFKTNNQSNLQFVRRN